MTKHEVREFIEQNLSLTIDYSSNKVHLLLVFRAADIYEEDTVISKVTIKESDLKSYET